MIELFRRPEQWIRPRLFHVVVGAMRTPDQQQGYALRWHKHQWALRYVAGLDVCVIDLQEYAHHWAGWETLYCGRVRSACAGDRAVELEGLRKLVIAIMTGPVGAHH